MDEAQEDERAQVERVFSLSGGELEQEPWETEGWTFHYWYAFPPEYAERELDPTAHQYRTVVRSNLLGAPPERLGPWLKVATYTSSGEVEDIGTDGSPTGEYTYIGDGWAEVVYRYEPGRLDPSDAGCYVDGHWGQYGTARVVVIAQAFGWEDAEAIDVANKHLASMGPDGKWEDVDLDTLVSAADDAEAWLNEYVAPEGYAFGWHDGEFFLWSEEDWEQEA